MGKKRKTRKGWVHELHRYGTAWTGDRYNPEATRVEGFELRRGWLIYDDLQFWDHKPGGVVIVNIDFSFNLDGITEDRTTTTPAVYSIASGKLVG